MRPLGPLPHHGPWGALENQLRAGLPTGTDVRQQREGPEEPGARYPRDGPPSVMPPGWGTPDSQARR